MTSSEEEMWTPPDLNSRKLLFPGNNVPNEDSSEEEEETEDIIPVQQSSVQLTQMQQIPHV